MELPNNRGDNAPTTHLLPPRETSVPGGPIDSQNNTSYCHCPRMTPQPKGMTLLLKTPHSSHWAWKNQAGHGQQASSWRTQSQSVLCKFQREKHSQKCYSAVQFINPSDDQPGREPQWYKVAFLSQFLISTNMSIHT